MPAREWPLPTTAPASLRSAAKYPLPSRRSVTLTGRQVGADLVADDGATLEPDRGADRHVAVVHARGGGRARRAGAASGSPSRTRPVGTDPVPASNVLPTITPASLTAASVTVARRDGSGSRSSASHVNSGRHRRRSRSTDDLPVVVDGDDLRVSELLRRAHRAARSGRRSRRRPRGWGSSPRRPSRSRRRCRRPRRCRGRWRRTRPRGASSTSPVAGHQRKPTGRKPSDATAMTMPSSAIPVGVRRAVGPAGRRLEHRSVPRVGVDRDGLGSHVADLVACAGCEPTATPSSLMAAMSPPPKSWSKQPLSSAAVASTVHHRGHAFDATVLDPTVPPSPSIRYLPVRPDRSGARYRRRRRRTSAAPACVTRSAGSRSRCRAERGGPAPR